MRRVIILALCFISVFALGDACEEQGVLATPSSETKEKIVVSEIEFKKENGTIGEEKVNIVEEEIFWVISFLDDNRRGRAGSILSDKDRRFFAKRVSVETEELGIDPILFVSMMWVESRLNKNARSYKGAIGLCQIMPLWVRNRNNMLKKAGIETEREFAEKDLYDPRVNIHLGAEILMYYIDFRDGDVNKGLATYNGSCRSLKRCKTWYPKMVRTVEKGLLKERENLQKNEEFGLAKEY